MSLVQAITRWRLEASPATFASLKLKVSTVCHALQGNIPPAMTEDVKLALLGLTRYILIPQNATLQSLGISSQNPMKWKVLVRPEQSQQPRAQPIVSLVLVGLLLVLAVIHVDWTEKVASLNYVSGEILDLIKWRWVVLASWCQKLTFTLFFVFSF